MTIDHTPGPWEAVDSLTVRGPFAFGVHDKPGVQICSLTHYVPATERAANARLIAQAPAMFELLMEAHTGAFDTNPVAHANWLARVEQVIKTA